MEEKNLKALIEKYLDGNCSASERAYLEQWYGQLNEDNRLELSDQFLRRAGKRLKKKLFAQINSSASGRRFNPLLRAACVISFLFILGGAGYYLLKNNQNKITADIPPGGNKAFLILGDGSTVNLDSVGNGQIAVQSGSNIVKLNTGQLVYHNATDSPGASPEVQYNTLKVPLGGQYHLTLPDGTKVWVNAGSSLKFPTSFKHLKDRRVVLEGEAYFEVFHDSRHPFYVNTGHQQTRVLGTHFDIEGYPEDHVIKTTLLQGSIKVINELSKDSCLLLPGKQAVMTDHLKVRNVDIDDVVDWKEGYFIFDNEPLQVILTRVARWYDVQVVFDTHAEKVKLDGIISKNTPLSEVLSMLSATDKVNFKLEGKVLHVLQ